MLSFRHVVSYAASLSVAALLAACGGAESENSASSASPAASELRGMSAKADTTTTATWVWCASEGGACVFTGTRQVRYGTSTQYTTRTATGSIACDNSVFGDPVFGKAKSCWYAGTATATPILLPKDPGSVNTTTTSWQYCTWEGGTCNFTGTRQVRFGTTTQNVTRTLAGPVVCSTAAFGDPAYGQSKSCWLGSTTTSDTTTGDRTTGDTTNGGGTSGGGAASYTRIQMFPLANPSITAEAGQDITLRVRFYGVKLPDQSKVFTHLKRDGDDYTIHANALHHYEWIPTQTWNGYTEYDYVVNVPAGTPAGTYRITSGIHQGVTPYAGRMDRVDCNGTARVGTANAVSVQTCAVGRITVLAPTRPASTATDGPMNMFYVTGRAWTPAL